MARDNGPPEDWIAVLGALLEDDPVALAKVTSVITGFLARFGAYDLRDSWDDLIQEVLIRLMQSARRNAIREPRAFITYVGTITRNLLRDWIRREIGQRDLPSRLEPGDPPTDPDVLVDLRGILDDLPLELRQVVEAVYLEGRSYEEAAKLLDLPLGTFKRRLTRARKEIRKKMLSTGGPS